MHRLGVKRCQAVAYLKIKYVHNCSDSEAPIDDHGANSWGMHKTNKMCTKSLWINHLTNA